MTNPMLALTSGISPRGIDTYNLPPTMLNLQMSLPTIKSDPNDNDPKVSSMKRKRIFIRNHFSANVVVHQRRNRLKD